MARHGTDWRAEGGLARQVVLRNGVVWVASGGISTGRHIFYPHGILTTLIWFGVGDSPPIL
jgi:hypothetical protein